MQFNPPWLAFNKSKWSTLQTNKTCQVAIIGAGISGILTLYSLLTKTKKQILIVEKNQVASGATSNNAGLVHAAMGTPFANFSEQASSDKIKQTYTELDNGFQSLKQLIDTIDAQDNFIPINYPTLGFSSLGAFVEQLKQEQIKEQIGRPPGKYLVAENVIKDQIPESLIKHIQFVEHEKITNVLDTIDKDYIAAIVPDNKLKGARINSAKLCYQILAYLERKFPSRFQLYEDTEVTELHLNSKQQILKHKNGVIFADDVILCTNGYKKFSIYNGRTQQKLSKLQDSLKIKEGYLAAYFDSRPQTYFSVFFPDQTDSTSSSYFYLTRTPFPEEPEIILSMLGGPEFDLLENDSDQLMQERANATLVEEKRFLKNTFALDKYNIHYFWRGIVAYTPDGSRWVGKDSEYPHLWYNLGCNGTGILPAIVGAEKIAKMF